MRSAEAEADVAQQRVALLRRLSGLTQACVEAGEAGRLDVLAIDAERLDAEAEQIDARARITQSRLTLARLLGRPSAAADWTLAPLDAERSLGADASERAMIEAAFARRPDVDAARWTLAALGEDAAIARWA